MTKNKKIPTHILESLKDTDQKSKLLFFELWLKSDCAGIVPNSYGSELESLFKLGMIKVTNEHIVLSEYLSSNYGKELKPKYNPHKPVVKAIEKAGFTYNLENNAIDIPGNAIVSDFSSLDKLKQTQSSISTKRESLKPVEQKNGIIENLSSIRFALALAALLTIGQSFHTGYALYIISDLPEMYRLVFAIGTALLLDALIIYFVACGSVKNSFVFLTFSTMMNVYAFHFSDTMQYWSYNSFFALGVAFIIPYSIHAVASRIHSQQKSIMLHA